MSAEADISRGSLRNIFDQGPEAVGHPILQCVQIKHMDNKAGEERYRIVLSDMDNFIQSMLAQQMNTVITSGQLKKGVMVRLKGFHPQIIKDRKILVVIELEVLPEYGELEKLGSPVALEPNNPAPKIEPKNEQPAEIGGGAFYGNNINNVSKPAIKREQQSTALVSRNGPPAGLAQLFPIEALSPYTHKWTIKARCVHKSEVKTWHNKNGEGKLFSVNLLDESGEIRATGFKEQCDQLYDQFREGGVYYISNCAVKLAKKQFSNVNNDYELTFQNDSIVEPADDPDSVPQVRYNFTSIGDLQSVEPNTTIDTIGVLKDVGEVSEIISKTTSKPYQKRELTIVDNSMHSVRLTIWGPTAQNFDASPESIVAFKGVKVSDFGGRSLSLLSSGSMNVDPDIDEAHNLKGWYDANGRTDSYMSHQQANTGVSRSRKYKTIAQVNDEQIGMSDQPEYFNLKATVVYIKHDNFAYPACASQGCNKKVVEVNPDEWRCEKCNVTHSAPEYRYIMSCNVSDHTGQLWLSCFDESGRTIMGMPANELWAMKEDEENPGKAEQAFQNATCKTLIFNVKAKMDTFQDQQRVRYQVTSVSELNFQRECATLIETLKQYQLNDDSLFVN
ncbi:Nucleic acid binding OB-fold tRNA/helicase-type [Lasiodiplodia theobromae]|uniref:Replication protein A subunit n=2 Tax=Lasiodiplodia TaxID=66739 RepID=A0A5N5CWV9_9PEZI|nr:Replication factor A protein 1 [Lasiodiplodia theobromae]KAF9634446.1 Nucleic acid binding OB-fold tRNA/helicase-type [Lasiodiplodia theobromae]KAK0660241.1 Replication factor A protein 1 [Lasiodiplodia hormozganensis]